MRICPRHKPTARCVSSFTFFFYIYFLLGPSGTRSVFAKGAHLDTRSMEREVTLDCWVVKGSWLGHLSRKCRRARSIKKQKKQNLVKMGWVFLVIVFLFSTALVFDLPYILCYTAVGGLYDSGMNLSRPPELWRITCDNGRLWVPCIALYDCVASFSQADSISLCVRNGFFISYFFFCSFLYF